MMVVASGPLPNTKIPGVTSTFAAGSALTLGRAVASLWYRSREAIMSARPAARRPQGDAEAGQLRSSIVRSSCAAHQPCRHPMSRMPFLHVIRDAVRPDARQNNAGLDRGLQRVQRFLDDLARRDVGLDHEAQHVRHAG